MKWRLLSIAILSIIFLVLAVRTDGYNQPEPIETVEEVTEVVEAPPEPIDTSIMLQEINDYRAENGLHPLTPIPELQASAMEKCLDMQENEYFAHVNPDTGEVGPEIAFEYYPSGGGAGENLYRAQRQHNPMAVAAWQNSPEHDELLLYKTYTKAGLAQCQTSPEWTRPTDFGYVVLHVSD